MNERTLKLKAIMAKHGLSCRDVGEILSRTEQTVTIWRCSNNPGERVIPSHLLELLELKLTAQTQQ